MVVSDLASGVRLTITRMSSLGGVILRPHRGVPGLSRTALWRSWKEIRKKFRESSLRDVVDWVDFDLAPEKWIRRLLADVNDGRYEPRRPERFALGKSKGMSRWMTLPAVPDLVLFHCLATRIVARARGRRRRHRHVYFMRDQVAGVQKKAADEARRVMSVPAPYRSGFHVWLRLHQYRRLLIFKRVFKYIVVTDITNFFDSIVYTQLEGSLFELGIARNVVGLLFLILERLSIRDAYSALPRIGLPVDEFDCSRCLAHLILFPHDDRMVEQVGEDAYVRWMDDQNFGVQSEADAYKLLAAVNTSLRRIHLVPNASKTKILTIQQARRHFHFDLNDALDRIEKLCGAKNTASERARARRLTRRTWKAALSHQGVGEWAKILKRFYRVAGCLRLRLLVRRAHGDLLEGPELADRIAGYLRVVCPPSEYIARADAILRDDRIVYQDVKRAVVEEFFRLEPTQPADIGALRRMAATALRSTRGASGGPIASDVAVLMLLRFGDRRSDRTIASVLAEYATLPAGRALGFVLASSGASGATTVRSVAERELEGPLRVVSRFTDAVAALPSLPNSVKARLTLHYDPMERRVHLDTRIALIARLFARGGGTCRQDVLAKVREWQPKLSSFEARMMVRLLR